MTSVASQANTRHTARTYWSDKATCGHDARDPWSEYETLMRVTSRDFSIPFSSVLNKAKQMSLFVDIDPDVLGGSPRIGGTRIPVHMVLSAIEEHGSIKDAVRAYGSSLDEDQVRDALSFSINVLECSFEHQPAATY